jgi:DNA-binding beta-propeller fold protein YncE
MPSSSILRHVGVNIGPRRSLWSTRGSPKASIVTFAIPSAGPHGLDLDLDTRLLFCACDSGMLITLDAHTGKILGQNTLSGAPDVVFFDRVHKRLYVAVGDPGTIDVFDTKTMEKLASVATEKGAHTFALAPAGDQVYAFLPMSHRAAIFEAVRT